MPPCSKTWFCCIVIIQVYWGLAKFSEKKPFGLLIKSQTTNLLNQNAMITSYFYVKTMLQCRFDKTIFWRNNDIIMSCVRWVCLWWINAYVIIVRDVTELKWCVGDNDTFSQTRTSGNEEYFSDILTLETLETKNIFSLFIISETCNPSAQKTLPYFLNIIDVDGLATQSARV